MTARVRPQPGVGGSRLEHVLVQAVMHLGVGHAGGEPRLCQRNAVVQHWSDAGVIMYEHQCSRLMLVGCVNTRSVTRSGQPWAKISEIEGAA